MGPRGARYNLRLSRKYCTNNVGSLVSCLSCRTNHDVINTESGSLLVKGSEESVYHYELLTITAICLRCNYTKHTSYLHCIALSQSQTWPTMVKDNETVIEYASIERPRSQEPY